MEVLQNHMHFFESKLAEVEFPKTPNNLYDPLRYFLRLGGKRIRPILTLMAAELFDKNKSEVINQALAIELFHNFTLIHDDIMDNAPLRRGMATVHEKWNSNVGILSGDALLIVAYQHLCRLDGKYLPDVMKIFNQTAIEVCEGQQMDMEFESRMDVTTAEYIEMIRLKTSVLLGAALKIGAIISDASDKNQELLYQFGVHIGIAFQIQDDILDFYADPEKFGKQVGGDVLANKKTILYLTAISNSNPSQLTMLKELLDQTEPEIKLARTRELYDHLDVRNNCRQLMEKHFQIAMNAFDEVSVSKENKIPLQELAKFLMNRDS